MRQQLGNFIRPLRRQSRENILQVAYGSCPLSRADWIKLMIAAARFPLRSDLANNQFERPRAHGRIWLSGSQTRLPASTPLRTVHA
jgi:hypothetical protein